MYLITKTYNNGYGCPCCKSEWDYENWSESLPSLEFITNIVNNSDSYEDANIVAITIEDGSNGRELYNFTSTLHRARATFSGRLFDKEIYANRYDKLSYIRAYKEMLQETKERMREEIWKEVERRK